MNPFEEATESSFLIWKMDKRIDRAFRNQWNRDERQTTKLFVTLLPLEGLQLLEELLPSHSKRNRGLTPQQLFGIPSSNMKAFVAQLLPKPKRGSLTKKGNVLKNVNHYLANAEKLAIENRTREQFVKELSKSVQNTIIPHLRKQLISVSMDESGTGAGQEGGKVYWQDKCRKECARRKLSKGVTIPNPTKYHIAVAIGMKPLPKPKDFKSGNKIYHRVSKMLSELGYSKKKIAKD